MGNLEQAAEKKPLIVLTGPTAVGKTALSIQLARRIGGEIISADSMQVYRHMDIGTAKIRLEEMDGVPHHLIDILEPTEDFNVVRFQALARAAAEDIYSRGKIPIVAGGTGFYIQALLNDIDFTQNDENTQFREEMERLAAEQGAEVLHERLRAVDPESAEAIHANNVKRVIRALEYYEQTGEKTKKSVPYLINLVDSPGHIDFSSDVSAAVQCIDALSRSRCVCATAVSSLSM